MNRVRGGPLPGSAREDWRIVVDLARALGAPWPEYASAEDVWNEFADLAPNWYGIRYDRLEENGLQWPCPDREHPGTPYLHAPQPARRAAGAGSSRSSTSRRSSSRTPSTRSCSRPAARSTTTTRRP